MVAPPCKLSQTHNSECMLEIRLVRYVNITQHETAIMTKIGKALALLVLVTSLSGCISPNGPHNNWGRDYAGHSEHHQD
jgi:hypothetical protein